MKRSPLVTVVSLLAVVLCLLALSSVPSFAQAPAPGLVPYCPPGQPQGWAPPNHPSVQQYPCTPYALPPSASTDDTWVSPYDPTFRPPVYVPPPVQPNPAQPWTLAPDKPMEVGHVYVNPYGLVYAPVGIQGQSTQGSGFSVPLGWRVILLYQSTRQYAAGVVSSVYGEPVETPRGMRWEIEP